MATIDEVWAGATLSALGRLLATEDVLPRTIGPAIRAHAPRHGTTYATTTPAYLEAHSDVAAAPTRARRRIGAG
ncbi:hypothetical protein [Streptomyces sp. CC224B]|uniref:hypothetical protein n=1 Tax=Streptomyces sp. CC224B TaxID=3044571 RepID=UPI0024A93F71|nr:hypothetical protein [Streptomyces sp. CC224B]